MKKTITAFLLVGSVLLTGCENNESTDNSLVNDELPQVAGTISESYDGFEDTTGESNSKTVFSQSSRAVAKGADTPTSGSYFSFDENMPANTGSKVNLTKYVQVVTNGNSDQTTTFKAYILNDSNNQYVAFQVESGSTTIYLSKAKTLYVNVEAEELTATLEIYVSQSKLCADYVDFFSTLGNNYSLSKKVYNTYGTVLGNENILHAENYYYDDYYETGYVLGGDDKTYEFNLSSTTGTDLKVMVPAIDYDVNYMNGGFSNITDDDFGFTYYNQTVSGVTFNWGNHRKQLSCSKRICKLWNLWQFLYSFQCFLHSIWGSLWNLR